jgi:hygromycin-B 7''-O-kinase
MGKYLRSLHHLSLNTLSPLSSSLQPTWDSYAVFLHQQGSDCLANHHLWKDLPDHLLPQIESFLLPVEQLIDFSAAPHLVHADLTADHLLGQLEDGHWQSLAVIDWGDAMVGNLLYELVALHVDMFQGDKSLLRACLETYQMPPFFQADFPRKAMNMLLLHQFPMPAEFYQPHSDARSLQDLSLRLFGI